MSNETYISIKNAKEMLGVTSHTLRNWANQGKIDFTTTPYGIRLYNSKDLYSIKRGRPSNGNEGKICYCRVSSAHQTDDLERQKDFFRSKYPNHELVTDIGSGLNWKRKGFKAVLERAMQGGITELVVAHRDRLCRFAFELVEYILEAQGVKLIILDREDQKSKEQELCDDILSIIHVYSSREMGRRRYKKQEAENLPNGETEEYA